MKNEKLTELIYGSVFTCIAALAMLLSVCNAFSLTYDAKIVFPVIVLSSLILGSVGLQKRRPYMPFVLCLIGELILWVLGRNQYLESVENIITTAFLQLRTYFVEGRYAEIVRDVDQTWGLLGIGLVFASISIYTIAYCKKVRWMVLSLALAFSLPFLAGNVLKKETVILLAIAFLGIVLVRMSGAGGKERLRVSVISIVVGILALSIGVPLLAEHIRLMIMDAELVEKRMDEFWSGDIRDVFGKLGGDKATGGVNDGRLGNYDELERDDRVHLKISSQRQPNQTVYIRGFVGGDYTGRSWRRGDEKRFETEAEEFDIQNIKANRKYQYHTYPNQQDIPSQWKKTNSDYEKKVQKKYRRVPDKIETAFEETVQNQIIREDPENVIWEVAELLRREADYTWSPGKTPAGKDFAEYFFFENKKGYCTHFATTAVLLFRIKGIPARYVAGYSVEPEKFREQEDGKYLAEATGEDAHAWAEIYVSGKGWIPAETTPGYVEHGDESEETNPIESDWENDWADNQEEENGTDTLAQREENQKEVEQEKQEETEQGEQAGEQKADSVQGQDAKQKTKSYVRWGLLFGIGILLLFIIAGILFYGKRKKRRQQVKKGYSERTKEIFYQIYHILISEKVLEKESELDDRCIEKLGVTYPQIDQETWGQIFEIVYRANYGKSEVTKEEYLLVRRILLLLEKSK